MGDGAPNRKNKIAPKMVEMAVKNTGQVPIVLRFPEGSWTAIVVGVPLDHGMHRHVVADEEAFDDHFVDTRPGRLQSFDVDGVNAGHLPTQRWCRWEIRGARTLGLS